MPRSLALTRTCQPPWSGKLFILRLAPRKSVEVADDLNYANGIGVSPDQKTLYVSETVGNCMLKFKINADGSLSNRSNFALLKPSHKKQGRILVAWT